MKYRIPLLLFLFCVQFAFAQKKEQIIVSIERDQSLPAMIDRSQRSLAIESEGGRGVVSLGVGMAANLGTRALFQLIDNGKNRHFAEWTAPAGKDFFYDGPSFLGPLDLSGLHFHGITLRREVMDADGHPENALLVSCSIPEDRLEQYVTSRRFELQVDTLAIDLSKVKARYTAKKKIDIQISIQIRATWMDQSLGIHQDQQLGCFNICLSNLKYQPAQPVITYSAEQARNLISGSCFFVPRSYGAYVGGGEYKNCWSAGEFEAILSVKEATGKKSGKNVEFVHDYLQKSLPTVIEQMATNEKLVGSSVVEIIKSY